MLSILFLVTHIKRYLWFLMLVTALALEAQPPLSWVKELYGTADGNIFDMETDPQGNVYVLGDFYGTLDFDPSPATQTLSASIYSNLFLLKLNPQGNFVWVRQLCPVTPGAGFVGVGCLKVDSLGNSYLAGNFSGTVDFDPGAGTYTLSNPGNNFRAYVLKLNSAGNLVWCREFASPGELGILAITVNAKLSVIMTGRFYGTFDFDPGAGTYNLTAPVVEGNAFIAQLDQNGAFKWARSLSGPGAGEGLCVSAVRNGGIFFGGYVGAATDMDPGPGVQNCPSVSGFVCKLDSGGMMLFNRLLPGECKIQDLVCTGGINVAGTYSAGADLDPGPALLQVTPAITPGTEAFFLQMDSTGALVWARQIICSGPTSHIFGVNIQKTRNKEIIFAASFTGKFDFDPGPGVIYYSFGDDWDASIGYASYDSTGNYQWAHAFGRVVNPYAVTLTKGGEIFCGSEALDTLDVDPTGSTFTIGPAGAPMFIKKVSFCTLQASPNVQIAPSTLTMCAGEFAALSASGAGSYFWPHMGLTTPSVFITPSVSTIYEVAGFGANGCANTATINVHVNQCLALPDRDSFQPAIYPNPTSGIIQCSAPIGSVAYLFDPCGKLLLETVVNSSTFVLDLKERPPGLYVLKIQVLQQAFHTSKIIKN